LQQLLLSDQLTNASPNPAHMHNYVTNTCHIPHILTCKEATESEEEGESSESEEKEPVVLKRKRQRARVEIEYETEMEPPPKIKAV